MTYLDKAILKQVLEKYKNGEIDVSKAYEILIEAGIMDGSDVLELKKASDDLLKKRPEGSLTVIK